MATYRNEKYITYNQTVGVRQNMDEAVRILTPSDVPLQQWLSTDDTNVTKVEWLEDELMPQTFVWTSKTGTSADWTVTSPDTSLLRVGDVYGVKDGTTYTVQVIVLSVTNPTTAHLAGFAGNTTSPSDGATLELLGQYNAEGGDPLEPRSIERVAKYNITQIGQEAVQATRTARNRGSRGGLYGMGDPYSYELGKKFKELAIRFERSLINGVRVEDTNAKKRFMGGFFYYLTTNSTSDVKANIKTALNAALRKSYDAGGTPDTIMVSPAIKSVVAGIDETIRREGYDSRSAGYVVDSFMSDFGAVDIVINRHLPKTKGLVLKKEDCTLINFDPYFHEVLAKTGDSTKGEIVGEKTLKVKNEVGMGVLTITDA